MLIVLNYEILQEPFLMYSFGAKRQPPDFRGEDATYYSKDQTQEYAGHGKSQGGDGCI